jgi:hypothetical protein
VVLQRAAVLITLPFPCCLVWAVSDALRYTVVLSLDTYTAGVQAAVARLEKQGIQAIKLKNYWGGSDGYFGINDVFGIPSPLSSTGILKFEVQFHTPESFRHKMAVHTQYEEFRLTLDPVRKLFLYEDSIVKAKRVRVPVGALELQTLTTHVMPGKHLVSA